MVKTRLIIICAIALLIQIAFAHTIPYPVDSKEYNAYKHSLIGKSITPEASAPLSRSGLSPLAYKQQTRTGLLVPYDTDFQLALSSNDDNYTSAISIPFAFDFYGSTQTEFYINNNGNISFGNPFSTYTSTGFPIDEFPMLAAFWADVDTRNAASGQVYYKIEPTRVTILWNGVGYYSNHADKINTFEVIFSDGTDPLIGIGNNVAFSYGDMQWTTGDVSGGSNGFGGTPATVGLNKGDGVHYGLIGRFDHEGTDYNGPGGAASGISYLDNQLFTFSTMMGNNIPPIFTGVPSSPLLLQAGSSTSLNITSVSPNPANTVNAVVNHDFPSGFSVVVTPGNPCSISIEIDALNTNLGLHTIEITATDNGSPILSSSVSINVTVYSLSEYLLAVNSNSRDLSVIDLASQTVYGPFLSGQLGTGSLLDIVVSPDNQFALVSNFEEDTVFQLNISDPLNPSVTGQYYLGFPAEDIALSQDGRFALVADGGTQTYLAVLDLQARTTVQIVNIAPRFAQGVSLGPDGKVLVNDYTNGYVYQYLLDLDSGQLSPTPETITAQYSFNTAISPNGTNAIACGSSTSGTKVLRLNADNTITTLQTLNIPTSQCAAYSSDGTKVLIGTIGGSNNTLQVFNVQPNGTLAFSASYNLSTISSGGYFGVDPIAISSDNSTAFIANLYDTYSYLSSINLASGLHTQINTGSPVGLAIANNNLVSQFSYTSTSIGFGSQVQFYQHSIGAPTSFLWNFGDGGSSTEANPYHAYLAPGIYNVSLTVYRGIISHTSTQAISIAFDNDIHLTLAGSPYYFGSTITVLDYQSLTIDSGVTVNFGPNAGMVVNGLLSASGVTFSGNETSGWQGITLNTLQSPLLFDNCSIWHAIQALKLNNTSLSINNLLINKSNTIPDELGIWILGASNVVLNNVQVLNYSRGIIFNNEDLRISSSATLTNIRIRNSNSSIRPTSRGLEVVGAVGLAMDSVEIEEFDEGVYWDGQGTTDYRTTPSLTNIRIRNTGSGIRSAGFGIKLVNLSSVVATDDSIGGYPTGLAIENLEANRTTTAATLTNIRIRNSNSSIRDESFGLKINGNVAANINDMESTDYNTGLFYQGSANAQRVSASLTNIRIRNTNSSIRSTDSGMKLIDIGSVTVENDTIEGYSNGFSLETTSQERVSSTATITNIRIRNTNSSIRTETIAASLKGSINANISDVDLENYLTGLYYEGDGQPFARTTPTLTNIRIRNTGSGIREPLKGIVLNNLSAVNLSQNTIYFGEELPSNAAGTAISLQDVGSAAIERNTVWGFQTGLGLNNSNADFQSNIIWSKSGELQTPVSITGGSTTITNNCISFAGGLYPGAGNVDRDPLFVAPQEGNFYLKPRSPLKDTSIGALGFDFAALAAVRQQTLSPAWNLIGVPYMTLPGQNTPINIFADDLNPFYVAPTYTSIVQMNPTAVSDSLGHLRFTYSGAYNVPSSVVQGRGYWVRNPYQTDTPIDVYGLMDDGSYNLELQGSPGPNNGWFLLANPYDQPINFQDGSIMIDPASQIAPWAYVYNRVSNSYTLIDSNNPGNIPPWSGFFVKANRATDKLYFNYPTPGRQQQHNDPVISTNLQPGSNAIPDWQLSLSASTNNHNDAVTLGIAEVAKDTYDTMDVPELPGAPFSIPQGINLCVLNNDWDEAAGVYTRDIRKKSNSAWTWNLLLNIENLLEEGKFQGVVTLANSQKLPTGYRYALSNLATGQSCDIANDPMLLSLDISATDQNTPWLIPLTLQVNRLGAIDTAETRDIVTASNYPNPFNPETTISYTLGKASPVKLEIYNLKGQLVNRLVNANQSEGNHSVVWNGKDGMGRDVASGFYFYRLSAGTSTITNKILMMK